MVLKISNARETKQYFHKGKLNWLNTGSHFPRICDVDLGVMSSCVLAGFVLSAILQAVAKNVLLILSFLSDFFFKCHILLVQLLPITNSAAFELWLRQFFLVTLLLMLECT